MARPPWRRAVPTPPPAATAATLPAATDPGPTAPLAVPPAAPPAVPNAAAAPRTRLRGVDVARGLAVLGMFGAHVAATRELALTDPDSWLALVHGRSSILFAVLAGVSVALTTGRTRPPAGEELVRARLRLLVRAVLVFALGGLLQLLITPVGVILESCAVLFVLCLPLLRWRPRALFALALAIAVVMGPLHLVLVAVLGTWTGAGGLLGTLLVTGTYPVLVWAAFVVAELGVGRCDLRSAAVRRGLVAAGVALAVVGYGGALAAQRVVAATGFGAGSAASGSLDPAAGSSPELVPADQLDLTGLVCADDGTGYVWCEPSDPTAAADAAAGEGVVADPGLSDLLAVDQFVTAAPHSGTTFEVLGSGGVALALLGLCLVAGDRLGRLLSPLAAVGAMPLTAYALHLVAIAAIGERFWDLTPGQRTTTHLWFIGVALVGCTAHGRLLGRGPLERGCRGRRRGRPGPDRSGRYRARVSLAVRVIPCLDVDAGRVVKGVNFRGLRDAGDPVELAARYDAQGADELTFLDVTASSGDRETTYDVVRRTAEQVFIPLTVGGGVRSPADVDQLLRAGADKVGVNTAAIARPELVAEIADRFGSQVLVLSLDARRCAEGTTTASGWEVTTHGGRRGTGLDVVEWAARVAELGAGELLLNSMDADGTERGFDLAMIAAVRAAVSIPVIASGGAGRVEHFPPAVAAGADAVLAASVFHFGQLTVGDVKDALRADGVPVR